MQYRFLKDNKVIEANSPEEFVHKMRNTSFAHTGDNVSFMSECADRAKKLGLDVRSDSEYNFLTDMLELGLVVKEISNWN